MIVRGWVSTSQAVDELITQGGLVTLTGNIIIELSHHFAHAMTDELLWHVHNYDLIGQLETKWEAEVSQDFNHELINHL